MYGLELWKNPHLDVETRLEIAIGEIDLLRNMYANLYAEHQELVTLLNISETVAYQSCRTGFISKEKKNPDYNLPLIVKPEL
jgi:hypothetical protein